MPGSRPEVGSSRKSSDGLVSSSSATLTRLRCPPDRLEMTWSARLLQAELGDHLVDAFGALAVLGVAGEAQLGGVGQRAADGELGVQDVVLRDQADALPQLGVVLVQVAAVVADRALVGRAACRSAR